MHAYECREWGNQDGGSGGMGTVVEHEGDRWTKVKWDHDGSIKSYKNGKTENGFAVFGFVRLLLMNKMLILTSQARDRQ